LKIEQGLQIPRVTPPDSKRAGAACTSTMQRPRIIETSISIRNEVKLERFTAGKNGHKRSELDCNSTDGTPSHMSTAGDFLRQGILKELSAI
jgi:hypothetical protein